MPIMGSDYAICLYKSQAPSTVDRGKQREVAKSTKKGKETANERGF